MGEPKDKRVSAVTQVACHRGLRPGVRCFNIFDCHEGALTCLPCSTTLTTLCTAP